MAEKKPKFRQVTLFIPEDETLKEYMANARDAFFADEEMKKLMREPQVPFEDVLRELDVVHTQTLEKLKKKKKPDPSKRKPKK